MAGSKRLHGRVGIKAHPAGDRYGAAGCSTTEAELCDADEGVGHGGDSELGLASRGSGYEERGCDPGDSAETAGSPGRYIGVEIRVGYREGARSACLC